jgi:hypothetical protein
MSEGVTLEHAVQTASTGDVWLFRGKSFADVAIRAFTNAPVNHVGMVVALDDLPPLLWHAELGRSLPDVWTGERQRGVQLHLLEDAVRTWHDKRYDGKPFPTTLGLARQWLHGRVRREASFETIYCAELVATTYQHMGLLPNHRPASWYDPGRFWSGDQLGLVPPFDLAAEVAVSL